MITGISKLRLLTSETCSYDGNLVKLTQQLKKSARLSAVEGR